MPNVRGHAIAIRLRFIQERLGPSGWNQIAPLLPAPVLERLAQPVDPDGWVPIQIYDALSQAIVQALGGGEATFEEIGAYAAEQIARLLDQPRRDPFEFFKHISEIHRRFFDFGDMSCVRRPGGCLIEVDYCGQALASICHGASGFYRRCAEMNGGRRVVVEVLSCQIRGEATCLLKVTWRKIRRTIAPGSSPPGAA